MSKIRNTLRQISKLPFLHSNLWEIIFDDTQDSSLNQTISFLAQKITIPSKKINWEYHKPYKKYFPSKYQDFDQITISFIETEDFRISDFLDNWQNSYLSNTGVFIAGVNPYKNIKLICQRYNRELLQQILSRAGSLSVGTATNKLSGFPNIFSPLTNTSLSQLSSFVGVELPDDMFTTSREYRLIEVSYIDRQPLEFDYNKDDLTIIEATFNINDIEKIIPN